MSILGHESVMITEIINNNSKINNMVYHYDVDDNDNLRCCMKCYFDTSDNRVAQ